MQVNIYIYIYIIIINVFPGNQTFVLLADVRLKMSFSTCWSNALLWWVSVFFEWITSFCHEGNGTGFMFVMLWVFSFSLDCSVTPSDDHHYPKRDVCRSWHKTKLYWVYLNIIRCHKLVLSPELWQGSYDFLNIFLLFKGIVHPKLKFQFLWFFFSLTQIKDILKNVGN